MEDVRVEVYCSWFCKASSSNLKQSMLLIGRRAAAEGRTGTHIEEENRRKLEQHNKKIVSALSTCAFEMLAEYVLRGRNFIDYYVHV